MKLNKKHKARFYDAEQTVKNFNEKYPVGSTVMWRSVGIKVFEHKEHEVLSEAFLSASGEPVVYLKGLNGYGSILEEFVKY